MHPRQILPGATYMVTRRCTQRQFLLVPSKKCEQVFLYSLAYAVKKTGVVVHAVMVMSNHYHLIVTDPNGVLPEFVRCLNRLVAKCMNAIHGRWENFWASEQASYVRLLDDEAIIDKIAYTLCNPVSAALVPRWKEWPGLRIGQPGRYAVERPTCFFRAAGDMPESLELEVVTPTSRAGLSQRTVQRHIDEAVGERERDARRTVLQSGRKFLGARAVMRQDPFQSPATAETRTGISPTVAGSNYWLRVEARARCAEFLTAYREALTAWREKKRNVCFPYGTYLMRCMHGVRCAAA